MKIQRYLPKVKDNLEPFGESYSRNRWDFRWFIGDAKMAVDANPSTEAESFIGGILVADDVLMVTPNETYPCIQRKNRSYGVMRGSDGGIDEIRNLISMFQKNDVVHMYVSSIENDYCSEVLVFSPTAPSKKLYNEGKTMEVILDQARIDDIKQSEDCIARLNDISNRVTSRLKKKKE